MKPVIICYHCRKRVSEEEIAAGLHNHFGEPGPRDQQLVPAAENKATS